LIHFVSSACAEAAVTELNSAALNDRQVHLRIDREGETDPDGASSIYVGNLPWQVLDGQLETAFSAYKPYYCRVMRNMSGRSRGFAILKFQTLEDSQEAIKNMHKFQIGGRAIEVKLLSITKLHWMFNSIDIKLIKIFFSVVMIVAVHLMPPLNGLYL
jgi:RNA recognition motif-containing protein